MSFGKVFLFSLLNIIIAVFGAIILNVKGEGSFVVGQYICNTASILPYLDKFIFLGKNNSVYVAEPFKNSLIQKYNLPAGSEGVFCEPTGGLNFLRVLNSKLGVIFVINLITGQTSTINIGAGCNKFIYDGENYWVLNALTSELLCINATTNGITRYSLSSPGNDLFFDTKSVYVCLPLSKTLQRVDLTEKTLADRIALGSTPVRTLVDNSTSKIWVLGNRDLLQTVTIMPDGTFTTLSFNLPPKNYVDVVPSAQMNRVFIASERAIDVYDYTNLTYITTIDFSKERRPEDPSEKIQSTSLGQTNENTFVLYVLGSFGFYIVNPNSNSITPTTFRLDR